MADGFITGTAAVTRRTLDLYDLPDRSGAPLSVALEGSSSSSGAFGSGLYAGVLGSTAAYNIDTVTGIPSYRAASAVNTQLGRQATGIVVPVSRNVGAEGAAAGPLLAYRAFASIRREALPAGVRLAFRVANLGTGHLATAAGGATGGAGVVGWEFISDPAINGGNWTARYKALAAAGPLLGNVDTGIAGTALARLVLEYVPGVTPALVWYANGRQVLRIVGQANMPAAQLGSGNYLGPSFLQGDNPGSAVGATDHIGALRVQIQDIG